MFMSHLPRSKRKSRARSLLILFGVVCLALLSSIMIFHVIEFNQSALSSTPQHTSSSVSFAGPITFGFVGGNSSAVTVAAGSTVHGAITIDILQAAPLRFYIDDRGYNTSSSTLPAGVSISLNVYGNSYAPSSLSQSATQPLSTTPLVATTLGETTVQYTISVASSVPKGAYDIRIVCWSFLNNGTHYDQPEVYEVTLSVQ